MQNVNTTSNILVRTIGITECVTDLDKQSEMTFLSNFWPLLNRASFSEAAGAVVEISSSLQITNLNQVKLAQIRETHYSSELWIVHNLENIRIIGVSNKQLAKLRHFSNHFRNKLWNFGAHREVLNQVFPQYWLFFAVYSIWEREKRSNFRRWTSTRFMRLFIPQRLSSLSPFSHLPKKTLKGEAFFNP